MDSVVIFDRYLFSCTQCGKCCAWEGEVHLEKGDIPRLAAALQVDEDSFIASHVGLASHRRGLRLADQADGSCIFLRNNQCTVYEARPEQCRRFPFPHTTPADCPGLRLLLDSPEPG